MKRYISTLALGLASVFSLTGTAVAASNAQQLMQANGCTGCHAAKAKLVGPSWGWIAYRYKDKKDALQSVTKFIINGGVGYWKPWTGGIPMPSHRNLSQAQARTIAKWILAQPPVQPPKR